MCGTHNSTTLLPLWRKTTDIPRYLCIFTIISAFIFGIFIGVLIPIYLLPNSDGKNITTEVNNNSNILSSPRSLLVVPSIERTFSSVTFLPKTAPTVNASLVRNGVYWSSQVEADLPRNEESISDWRKFVRKSKVVKIEEGCGRMQNRLVTFDNGTLSCCRYRQNVDQIQGEIFSYYLGTFVLNLPNLPPSTLGRVKQNSRQWSSVKAQLTLANWLTDDRVVVMTKFLPGLSPSYIPDALKSNERRLHPPDLTADSNLIQLAQWSDLIIFDYLTANLDRVVNNLYNLQWNPTMMDAPAHNLAQLSNGLLVFLDNESGLLHGYRLLDKYEHFHKTMLQSLCIFRKSTADVIKRLNKSKNIGELLRKIYADSDPEFADFLPSLPEKSIKVLMRRIALVHEQIAKCESLYNK